MASVLQRRLSLHRRLQEGNQKNEALASHLCRIQPLADIGSASSMIAHEINNILTPFGSYAALALKHPDDKELTQKALEKAILNCNQATKVMESLLALANGQHQDKTTVGLATLVDEVFTCLCRDFSKDQITVVLDIPPDLRIYGISVQIQQVLMNLILNAREAMLVQGGGTLTLQARTEAGYTVLEISDTGNGIPQEDIDTVFEAFYSTKDSSATNGECFGTGLGLSFCRLVMEAHDGHISVASQPDKGTTFTLRLPEPPPPEST